MRTTQQKERARLPDRSTRPTPLPWFQAARLSYYALTHKFDQKINLSLLLNVVDKKDILPQLLDKTV